MLKMSCDTAFCSLCGKTRPSIFYDNQHRCCLLCVARCTVANSYLLIKKIGTTSYSFIPMNKTISVYSLVSHGDNRYTVEKLLEDSWGSPSPP